jgi:hypothetical protein
VEPLAELGPAKPGDPGYDLVLASAEAPRLRLADLPALLRDLAPTWGPYRVLTGVQLRDLLDDAGVRTTTTGNVPRLDPADLRRVLAGRG